jgi:hypothetical protein
MTARQHRVKQRCKGQQRQRRVNNPANDSSGSAGPRNPANDSILPHLTSQSACSDTCGNACHAAPKKTGEVEQNNPVTVKSVAFVVLPEHALAKTDTSLKVLEVSHTPTLSREAASNGLQSACVTHKALIGMSGVLSN